MRSNIFLNGYFIILETIFCLLQQKQSTWFEDRNDEWDIYIYSKPRMRHDQGKTIVLCHNFFSSTFGHPVMSNRQVFNKGICNYNTFL